MSGGYNLFKIHAPTSELSGQIPSLTPGARTVIRRHNYRVADGGVYESQLNYQVAGRGVDGESACSSG